MDEIMTQLITQNRRQKQAAVIILASDSDENNSQDLFKSNSESNDDSEGTNEIEAIPDRPVGRPSVAQDDNFFGTVKQHHLHRPNFIQNKNDSKNM